VTLESMCRIFMIFPFRLGERGEPLVSSVTLSKCLGLRK